MRRLKMFTNMGRKCSGTALQFVILISATMLAASPAYSQSPPPVWGSASHTVSWTVESLQPVFCLPINPRIRRENSPFYCSRINLYQRSAELRFLPPFQLIPAQPLCPGTAPMPLLVLMMVSLTLPADQLSVGLFLRLETIQKHLPALGPGVQHRKLFLG